MMAAQQPLKDGLEGLRVAWWFRHSQQNEQKTKKVTNSTKRGEVIDYLIPRDLDLNSKPKP